MNTGIKLIGSCAVFLLATISCHLYSVHCYGLHRKQDPTRPKIIARDSGGKRAFEIADSHIESHPTFSYSINDFTPYLLPKDGITYKDSDTYLPTQTINEIVTKTIVEIKAKKATLTHCTVLQRKNFNTKKQCGLIVLKMNEHPFVIKLFMETAKTFVDPYCKGVEPLCFFYMAGGAGRHTTGLTRIHNREVVRKKLDAMPQWVSMVELPRKWFWLPKQNNLIHLVGKNIDPEKDLKTTLPATYAIIADAIEAESNTVPDEVRQTIVIQLCNDLQAFIDPHYNNFIFKQQAENTFKITIIDTEHFPTISGMKKRVEFKSHGTWIAFLTQKCFADTYLRPKSVRKQIRMQKSELALC